jgi:hypothetical protein
VFFPLLVLTPNGKKIVLTKCDKANAKELQKTMLGVKKYLDLAPLCYPKVLPVSARKKNGIEELQGDVLAAAGIDFTSLQLRHRSSPTEKEHRRLDAESTLDSKGRVPMGRDILTGRPSKA